MITTFIYALIDPRTNEIRYIGKADKPKCRLSIHIKDAKWELTYKGSWIRSLLVRGDCPVLQIVDEVLNSEWQSAESAYITFFKEEGLNLTNGTPGGEGLGSGRDHPMFGKPRSEEIRIKLRLALKGRKHSLEARANMRKIKSPEHRAKITKAARNRSPETRLKMSEAQKGRHHSEETKAKMRTSHQKYHA